MINCVQVPLCSLNPLPHSLALVIPRVFIAQERSAGGVNVGWNWLASASWLCPRGQAGKLTHSLPREQLPAHSGDNPPSGEFHPHPHPHPHPARNQVLPSVKTALRWQTTCFEYEVRTTPALGAPIYPCGLDCLVALISGLLLEISVRMEARYTPFDQNVHPFIRIVRKANARGVWKQRPEDGPKERPESYEPLNESLYFLFLPVTRPSQAVQEVSFLIEKTIETNVPLGKATAKQKGSENEPCRGELWSRNRHEDEEGAFSAHLCSF